MNKHLRYYLFGLLSGILLISGLGASALLAQDNWSALTDYEEDLVLRLELGDTALRVEAALPNPALPLVRLTDARLTDADLVLYFENKLIHPRLLSFELEVSLYQEGKVIPIRQQLVLGGATTESFTVTFADITESGLYLHTSYELRLRQRIMGDGVSSLTAPAFRPPGRGLSYSAVGIGAGTLLWSHFLLDQRIDDTYATYQQLWEDEALDDAGLAEELSRLTDQQRWGKRIGYAAIGAGAIVLGYQWLQHRKRKRIYNTYCDPGVKLSLYPLGSSLQTGSLAMGLRLNINF